MDLDLVPEAICLLDKSTLSIQSANSKFCTAIAPISRFKGLAFMENFVSKEDHTRFRIGIDRALGLKVLFNLCSPLLFVVFLYQDRLNRLCDIYN